MKEEWEKRVEQSRDALLKAKNLGDIKFWKRKLAEAERQLKKLEKRK